MGKSQDPFPKVIITKKKPQKQKAKRIHTACEASFYILMIEISISPGWSFKNTSL